MIIMQKVLKYALVNAEDKAGFESRINTLIAEGWQPYGPTVIFGHLTKVQYRQPMVKYEPLPL